MIIDGGTDMYMEDAMLQPFSAIMQFMNMVELAKRNTSGSEQPLVEDAIDCAWSEVDDEE